MNHNDGRLELFDENLETILPLTALAGGRQLLCSTMQPQR